MGPVLEFPTWPPNLTIGYSYHQNYDWFPRLNGVGSHFPTSFISVRDSTAVCPSQQCYEFIKKSIADYLIIHTDLLDINTLNSWNELGNNFPEFTFLGRYDEKLLYVRNKK